MSAPQNAINKSTQILARLDFSSPPNYPTDPNLYNNLAQLNADVQAVHAILTDPQASSGWCQPISDVLTLAGSNAYFADTSPNPNLARNEFIADWVDLQGKANCP